MSGHSEDPVAEESKRFFTFFNLSMALAAITGLEIVIIYVQTFESKAIIGVLFTTSILKFFGVIWWFMHLRWDKILNTVLFLMGLVIALGTYFAVIYMADHPIDIENFEVTALDNAWKAGSDYEAGAYVKHEESYYQAKSAHTAGESFDVNSTIEGVESSFWIKVEGIPHKISWKVNQADLIEINSRKPGNPFFHMYQPEDTEKVQGTVIRVLAKAATSADFRLKARSEAFWGETE